MKRHFWLMLLVCWLCPSLFAQKKNPVTTVIKEILPRQAKNLQGAVETMPADKFSFKPTPPQMTFGHLVTHMIDSNYYLCAKASDTPQPKVDMPKETDKEELVAALKASSIFARRTWRRSTTASWETRFRLMEGGRCRARGR